MRRGTRQLACSSPLLPPCARKDEECSRVCHTSTRQEGSHLQIGKRALTREQTGQNLDLGLFSLQNSDKINFCCSRHSAYGILLRWPELIRGTHAFLRGLWESPWPASASRTLLWTPLTWVGNILWEFFFSLSGSARSHSKAVTLRKWTNTNPKLSEANPTPFSTLTEVVLRAVGEILRMSQQESAGLAWKVDPSLSSNFVQTI